MGDKIRDLVSGYLEELAGKAKGGPKMTTFSIRLSQHEHARLVWLAKSLGTPKTPLAEKLLKAAVDEAIEQYARWVSPESAEEFLEEALENIEGPKPQHAPKPPHHKPHPPRPKHHKPKPPG